MDTNQLAGSFPSAQVVDHIHPNPYKGHRQCQSSWVDGILDREELKYGQILTGSKGCFDERIFEKKTITETFV